MLRKSVLQLASRISVKGVPLRTKSQLPSYLYSRRTLSTSQKNESHKPGSGSNVPESQSHGPKIITGGLALGSAVLAAYYYGYLDTYIGKEQQSTGEHVKVQINDKNTQEVAEEIAHPQAGELSEPISKNSLQDTDVKNSNADHTEKDPETRSELNLPEDSLRADGDINIQVKDIEPPSQENIDLVKDVDLPNVPGGDLFSDDATSKPSEESFDLKVPEIEPDEEQYKVIDIIPKFTSADENPAEIGITPMLKEKITTQDVQEVVRGDGTKKSGSLLDDYYLRDNIEEPTTATSKRESDVISAIEDAYDGYISKDGKLVLDFLQAIHAAEKRQAEIDAHAFALDKKAMKEKFEKELKDARARELMYAEKEAILDKELVRERAKAAASLKSLQEKFEEKLKTVLEEKEAEAELKLKKMHDLAKADLAAAIASEKASQIEKMAEANFHINALCMAFYAQSEEARLSHSVQKLALGALALEDALSKGLPIQKEIEALHPHLEGVDKDSLIALVLSSLPEETKKYGTDTLPQLNHKFDSLKGTLRHFSLIPPGGGGILSHSLARIASWLKVKEVDQSGDGIESLFNRVESLLAQGKVCEAADTLENGVKDSKASEIVDDWVRRARNRATTEQALTVLQSYATSISLT
ncbi:MICOS complex subunit MIC60, mitochondrial isoform X1 [Primulina huaijiensis]|uniref:MICOS complex subunit MIC60, mitochondrial isoform X1 n=1 Tax=Primulina huaijiensis TaxID=1492673 RepID=UPI003CC729C0